MKQYEVTFYKKPEKPGEQDKVLGRVMVDDHGVDENFTIIAKAFRRAEESLFFANRVKVKQVR